MPSRMRTPGWSDEPSSGESQEAHQGDRRAIEVGQAPFRRRSFRSVGIRRGRILVLRADDARVRMNTLLARASSSCTRCSDSHGSRLAARARRRKYAAPTEGRQARTRSSACDQDNDGLCQVQVHMRVSARISAFGAPCEGPPRLTKWWGTG